MIPRFRSTMVFAGSCLLTAAGWAVFWPETGVDPPAPDRPPTPEAAWTKSKTESALAAVDEATSPESLLAAANRLGEIPVAEIPATLESIELTEDHRLTLAAETLLIRWASTDGKGAMEWAWLRFRDLRRKSLWTHAFRQIGPAWAWRDPTGFGEWALTTINQRADGARDDTSLERLGSDTPILEYDEVVAACNWLVPEDPRMAFTLFQKRGNISSNDGDIVKSMNESRAIEEALLAFDDLETLKRFVETGRYTIGLEMTAVQLMERWRDLDPEGFTNSRYVPYIQPKQIAAALTETAEWISAAPEDRMESATRTLNEAKEFSRHVAAGNIAKEWAATDPDACRKWIESLPENALPSATGAYVEIRAPEALDETLSWIDGFNPAVRATCLVRAFDAWAKAHPGGVPEMTTWNETRRGAWRELEALKLATAP